MSILRRSVIVGGLLVPLGAHGQASSPSRDPLPPPASAPASMPASVAAHPRIVVDAPPRPLTWRFAASLAGTLTYRRAMGASFVGGGAEALIGLEHAWQGGALRLAFDRGETVGGLTYEALIAGLAFDWRRGSRTLLGMGMHSGALIIERFTAPGSTWSVMLGAYASLTVLILPRNPRMTPFAVVRAGADWLTDATQPAVFEVTTGLGFRVGGAP